MLNWNETKYNCEMINWIHKWEKKSGVFFSANGTWLMLLLLIVQSKHTVLDLHKTRWNLHTVDHRIQTAQSSDWQRFPAPFVLPDCPLQTWHSPSPWYAISLIALASHYTKSPIATEEDALGSQTCYWKEEQSNWCLINTLGGVFDL